MASRLMFIYFCREVVNSAKIKPTQKIPDIPGTNFATYIREFHDEVVSIRHPTTAFYLLHGDILSTVPDVLGDRCTK